ncbi:hypothetical protein [Bacillus sp. J33]|uniref:hypothetical protein n=1 Tax=Bacillus sp. J33 TaxID=935836 RepID=UPI0004B75382|nr:hypothetical protein [Bacillus sp. J33]
MLIKMAVLKLIVDFSTLLIGAEGARFLREKRVSGRPRGKRVPRAEINAQNL